MREYTLSTLLLPALLHTATVHSQMINQSYLYCLVYQVRMAFRIFLPPWSEEMDVTTS